ncbi:melanopsin-like [Limosa lapponica baueri]|uniref:Melanopsin-like n=1 Tax=Limosa lapponica baueri TaxID=1758121 RepID=A0A2I0TSA5_LIMLA|nr:melanopsin-like [Limosa lapponica baueri]
MSISERRSVVTARAPGTPWTNAGSLENSSGSAAAMLNPPGISKCFTLQAARKAVISFLDGLNMGTQPHAVTKTEVPDHVLYTVGTCVLIIGSIGIIGNLLVLYAFYRDVQKLGSCSRKSYLSQSMKNEWKLAKIAFVVIVVFVLSWSPYACVTLIAWAGKTIHNAVPCLRFLIRISKNDLLRGSINESSFRTSLSSHQSVAGRTKSTCVSSVSTGEATTDYTMMHEGTNCDDFINCKIPRSSLQYETWSDVELDPVEPAHKKLQPQRSHSFSTSVKQEKRDQLPKTYSCDAASAEKVSLSSSCLEKVLGRSVLRSPPAMLVTSSLKAASLPVGLNSSSVSRAEDSDTSQMGTQGSQANGVLRSIISNTVPRIIIIPTSETNLFREELEEEETELFHFHDKKGNLLDLEGLSSSTEFLEAVEKFLS